ncbi:BAG family molecular chaperone regulator 8, chloroplastic-like [Quillaja saponaria]|uniref:BAG family molecular chaperone regulator 8, chloroplastic-like n=1 Tax=Quillaja saponaria TaxID=32244 RepID=A0AAD7LT09_QUISA|nr:BAG family molecular chaperone regulator 8, chloroplastic-like [Quillaja saponaria]
MKPFFILYGGNNCLCYSNPLLCFPYSQIKNPYAARGPCPIKSNFSFLKSSISNEIHVNFEVLYHIAMDLLLKLDHMQGGDTMVRDGKRSVNKDLVCFLDFVDGIAAKSTCFPSKQPRMQGTVVKLTNLGF